MARTFEVDVDDLEQIGAIAAAINKTLPPGIELSIEALQAAAVRFITPRPDEPLGFGAVVKDHAGVIWTRWADDGQVAPWLSQAGVAAAYGDVDAAEKLSDGCPGD